MTQSATEYVKPLPEMAGFTQEFYQHCRRSELRFQRCKGCGQWRHVPRHKCGGCSSWEWEWAKSRGRGKVFTWTVTRRPMHPAFAEDPPYAPVVVELEEGVRMVTWLVDCPPDEIQAGMPVEVVFDDVTAEVTLPKFRRVGG